MAWVAGDPLQGGKYILERELGRGRFGITYLVRNKNSDRVNRAILTGMKLDPKQRSQSMREWLDLLGLTGETSNTQTPVPPEAKSKINWIAVTAIATLIAAIGTFFSGMAGLIPIFKPSPSPSPPSLSPSPSSTKTP